MLTVSLVFAALFPASAQRDSLLVMFWNLENFFDWTDGGQSASDAEFSPSGSRHWTPRRFYAKCNAVAKTILWTGDCCGRLPDAVGVAEVENEGVLRRLVYGTALYRYGYSYIHYDSPDPRGIDVGLIYRKQTMTPVSSRPVRIGDFPTRDILDAYMGTANGRLHLLVNHHPSKYGGAESAGRRMSAMRTLAELCDSLTAADSCGIVAVGDFNDTPDAEAFNLLKGRLDNLAEPLHAEGKGSIRYDGRWELIDMIMVSPALQSEGMEIVEPPFLMTKDSAHSGLKPLRTYTGPAYRGGVSDHLPVTCRVLVPAASAPLFDGK
ncbi:MAG: hypothetical protein HUK26_00110 [Duodenibacillus sp.]|nr:hypothetical protein [Duodenibacillus sp.]